MKNLFILLLAFSAISATAQTKTMEDANATQRTLSGTFDAIEVSSGIQLYLTQGNENSLAVSVSDPSFEAGFKTEVVDGVLKIYFDNKGMSWAKQKNRILKAYVSFKTLNALTGTSGSSVKVVNEIKTNELKLHFNSGALFKGDIKVTALEVEQNSGSLMDVTGSSNTLKIDVSSGAGFKGYDFATESCMAKASSGAGIKITINKELDASASSGGDIKYKGNAVVKNLSASSGGSVKKS